MEVDRRTFLFLATATCAGCAANKGAPTASSGTPITRTLDIGAGSLYAADGVYSRFRHQGVYLVRNGLSLVAISSDCTHRDCPVKSLPDHTFSCRCHGSKFDEQGHVLQGPATRNLPQFPIHAADDQHLIVEVTRLHFDEE